MYENRNYKYTEVLFKFTTSKTSLNDISSNYSTATKKAKSKEGIPKHPLPIGVYTHCRIGPPLTANPPETAVNHASIGEETSFSPVASRREKSFRPLGKLFVKEEDEIRRDFSSRVIR